MRRAQEIEDFDEGLAEAEVLRKFLGISEGDPEYLDTLSPARETIYGVECYSFDVGGQTYVVCSDSLLIDAYLPAKAEIELAKVRNNLPGAEAIFDFLDTEAWVAETVKNPDFREAYIEGAGTYVGDGEALSGYWYDIYER